MPRCAYLLEDKGDARVAASLLPSVDVRYLYDGWNRSSQGAYTAEDLTRWEAMYGVPHLRPYMVCDPAWSGLSDEEGWGRLAAHILRFEDALARIAPDGFLGGAVEGFSSWLFFNMCRRRHANSFLLIPSGLGGFVFQAEDAQGRLRVRTSYERFVREGPPRDLVDRAKGWIDRSWGDCSPQATVFNPWTAAKAARLARRITAEPPAGEKFFYFPLRPDDDPQLRVSALRFRDQLNLIQLIAESLPMDGWLYVREDPRVPLGSRPWAFYRRFFDLPRVRLLSPRLEERQVIGRSLGVLTTGCPSGWRAVLSGKPVFLFGSGFYEEFHEGVRRIVDLEELPAMLKEPMRASGGQMGALCYAAALMQKSDAAFLPQNADPPAARERALSAENVGRLAEIFRRRMEGPPL
ncbi:MAG: hypothetical protein ACT4O3_03040 [Elusimicrobiota bacterium]